MNGRSATRVTSAAGLLLVAVLLGGCTTGGPRVGSGAASQRQMDAAATNVQLARGYLASGRLEIALEKIERALDLDASSAEAHSLAGIIYEQIGDSESAGVHYRRSVALDGETGRGLNNYGQFLCKSGRLADGVSHLERAVRDPFYDTPAVALTNAGACYEGAGDERAAEGYYRRALEANERYPDALFRMSRLMLARDEAFRARAFLQRFEAVAAPFIESLRLGVQIEAALGNAEGVEQYSDALQRLFPDAAAEVRNEQSD